MEGIGFSLGLERLLFAMSDERKKELASTTSIDVFIIDFKRDGTSMEIADKLRKEGYSVLFSSFSRALGGALKMADRKRAKRVIIAESDGTYKLKDMFSRQQEEFENKESLLLCLLSKE